MPITTTSPAPARAVPAQMIPAETIPVETIMSALARGDRQAVFTLVQHQSPGIRAEVRRQLRRCGVHHASADDLDGLVLDVAMALAEVAGAWRPGGALPWVWARGRVLNVVRDWVGVHADQLDPTTVPALDTTAQSVPDEDVATTFGRMVGSVPALALIARACRESGLDEPALFWLLEYQMQLDQGDPSPSHTLAARHGIRPDAMRQRVSRWRRRLRTLADADPRFADLRDYALVA